jgi:hypothetical protein
MSAGHSIRILIAAIALALGTVVIAAAPVVQHSTAPGVVLADPERCC